MFLSKTQKIMKILKFHIKLIRETKYPNTNFVTRKNDLRGKKILYILLLVFCPKCIFTKVMKIVVAILQNLSCVTNQSAFFVSNSTTFQFLTYFFEIFRTKMNLSTNISTQKNDNHKKKVNVATKN